MKVCLIQLTRIGDIIQTYRAAAQLKAEKPNINLTLITRRRFSSQLNFLLKEVFDEIVEFETKDFFQSKDVNLKEAKLALHNFLFDVKKMDFDIVINLSFNKSSSFLTTLIPKELKMGLYKNNMAQVGIDDKWSQFIYSNVMESTNSPINLVDVYKSIIGAREVDVTNFETPKNKIITIHPFASTHKKSWGSSKWTEYIYKLLKDDNEVEVNIVGAKNDTDLADRIVNNPVLKIFNKRIHNKVGFNTIEDTFNLLSESHLFIGHDSMVSHLAGTLRMPSIVLSLGTVRPHETTPYNDRVVNLVPRLKCFPCQPTTKCELLPCHNSLSYKAVVQVTKNLLSKTEFSKENLTSGLLPFEMESFNMLVSSFDEAGLKLTDIGENNLSVPDTFKTYYRLIWSYYLNNKDIQSDIPKVHADNAAILNLHIEGTKHLFELYSHGFQFCNQILDESEKETPSVQFIQERVKKLAEIDELTSMTKTAYPYLAPIADFFFVNKANAAGKNIIEITNNNLIAFHEASNITAILNELLAKTIGPSLSSDRITQEV